MNVGLGRGSLGRKHTKPGTLHIFKGIECVEINIAADLMLERSRGLVWNISH